LSDNPKPNDLTEMILEVIHEKKPKSVEELIEILNRARILNLTEEEIIKPVMKLQAEGVIKLENHAVQSRTFATYLKTIEAVWYWMTIATGSITVALVLLISEGVYPWIYARNALGLVFVLFLPGYSFIKALFQYNVSAKTSVESLQAIVLIALSIGISLALVSILGLLLYYSPWGLDLATVVLSLLAFTSVFATAAVIREYQAKKRL
jgi:hypothetical protein